MLIGSGAATGGAGGAVSVTVGSGNTGAGGVLTLAAGESTVSTGGAVTLTSGARGRPRTSGDVTVATAAAAHGRRVGHARAELGNVGDRGIIGIQS